MFIGAVALLTGFNACDKDDDDGDSKECCTYSYTYGESTIKWKACSDGTYSVSYDGTVVYSGNWEDDYDSWSEMKAMILENYDGAKCD